MESTPRFRADEWVIPNLPGRSDWAIKVLDASGRWVHRMVDGIPQFRHSKAEADALVAELNGFTAPDTPPKQG